jgi:hypothetical protein
MKENKGSMTTAAPLMGRRKLIGVVAHFKWQFAQPQLGFAEWV